jgi:hypothetical protein
MTHLFVQQWRHHELGHIARVTLGVMRAMVLVAGVSAILTGCGSSGGGPGFDIDGRPIGPAQPSPFAGRWSGQWIDPNVPGGGTLNATISQSGGLTLAVSDPATGATGSGSGSITRAGSLTARYRYAGGAERSATGTVTIGANEHLLGQFEVSASGERFGSGRFDLVRARVADG